MTKVKQKMEKPQYVKMHGLGNDFIIVDNRNGIHNISTADIVKLSNRKKGIGCDQFIILEYSDNTGVFMRIYNADGGEAGACGNATRCVAGLLMDKEGGNTKSIETTAGILHTERGKSNGYIRVDMGEPKFDWNLIPLSKKLDTSNIIIPEFPELGAGVAVNVGNPHIVFFVDDVEKIDIERIGKKIEINPLFPEKVNVGFVQYPTSLPDDVHLTVIMKLKVWERGVGITKACGTGACAALVAGVIKKFSCIINKRAENIYHVMEKNGKI